MPGQNTINFTLDEFVNNKHLNIFGLCNEKIYIQGREIFLTP